ncbi:hypothetical protein ACF0H5_020934 [Mactra antiquata]
MTSQVKNNSMLFGFVALVTILSCNALRIKRSGVAGYDDPYGLTNALGLMERTQRENLGGFLNRRVPNDEDSYFNPNAGIEYELSPMSYLSALGYGDEEDVPEYAYRNQLAPYPFGEVPIVLDDDDSMGFGPKKRTAYNPRRVVPTLDELKTIFGEADVPIKRLAPIKRRQPDQTMETPEDDGSDKFDKNERSKQWRNLINAAQKLNGLNAEADKNDDDDIADNGNGEIAKENSLQDELTDAFSDADVGDDSEAEEEANGQGIETDQPLSKSKRASSGVGDTSDYILSLLKEISDLKETVSVLEMKQLLEDRENDFLANALKYSTLDQMNQDGEYVDKEYSDIAKATKIEELLQEFSEAVEDTEDGDNDENDGDIYAEEDDGINPGGISQDDTIKRSDNGKSIIEETNGEWLEEPVETAVSDDEVRDADAFNDNVFESADDINDNTGSDIIDDVILNDVDDQDQMEPADDESTLLLSKLINNLSPDTVQEILSELQEKQTNANNDMCPAVMELSHNCAFADEHNIPMDDEARNLCIRHQLCYTCGEALGISASRCDGGYKGTAIAECEGDLSCVKSAAYFLRLMTSQYHIYNSYSPDVCLNSCVKDFIYGVA